MIKTDNMFSSLYNHFILRDIIHIFSGGIFIYFLYISDLKTFKGFLELFFSNLYRFILFVLLSYFTGLIIFHIAMILKIAPIKIKIPKTFTSQIELMNGIKSVYDEYAVNFFERQGCMETFGASLATSLLLSIAPLIYLYFYWEEEIALYLIITNIILSIILIYISKSTHKYIEKTINQLFP